MCWGVLKRIQFAQRVNEVFTEHTARDQASFSAKINYWPPGFASQSLMFRLSKYRPEKFQWANIFIEATNNFIRILLSSFYFDSLFGSFAHSTICL